MKKLLAFLLCMLMAVSVFGALSVSAEEASIPAETIEGLVEFNGYSVRTNEYNGIRAEFDLDKAKLAELEATYDVKIDMLFAKAGAEAPDSLAKYEALQLDKAGATSHFYDTEKGGYLGKIYSEEDGKAKFFYTVTFNNASETNLNADLYFRLFVTLTDKSDATVTASIPVDCKSSKFNYAVSLYEVAKTLVDLGEFDNSFVRSALSIANGNYKKGAENLELLDYPLSAYSIVVDAEEVTKNEKTYKETLYLSAARACAGAFEEALGVGLPIRYNTAANPYSSEAYIEIVKDTTLGKYAYKITAKNSVITVSASTVPAAAAGCEALAKAIAEGGYKDDTIINGSIYSSYNYDSLYVTGALYQIDFFDSKASMGNLVGGTFGNASYYNLSAAAGYTDHYNPANFAVSSSIKTYFDDYIITVSNSSKKAFGGTMEIMAPWYTTNKYSSKTATEWEMSQTQYAFTESNVKSFQSKWQDKYLELGYDSKFDLAHVEDLIETKGEYTLQLVASLNTSEYYDENGVKKEIGDPNANSFQLGMTNINPVSGGKIAFGNSITWNKRLTDQTISYENEPAVNIDRAVSTVNEYLVSVSGYHYYAASASVPNDLSDLANTTLRLGVNAADYFVNAVDENEDNVRDGFTSLGGYTETGLGIPLITKTYVFKFGNRMNTHLYAVRVYGRKLSEAEVIQNHFADVAKYYQLDMKNYDNVADDKKLDVYKSLASIMIDAKSDASYAETKQSAQAAVSAAIEEAINAANN